MGWTSQSHAFIASYSFSYKFQTYGHGTDKWESPRVKLDSPSVSWKLAERRHADWPFWPKLLLQEVFGADADNVIFTSKLTRQVGNQLITSDEREVKTNLLVADFKSVFGGFSSVNSFYELEVSINLYHRHKYSPTVDRVSDLGHLLLQTGKCTDVVLKIKGPEVLNGIVNLKVHKAVLCARSPVFDKLFHETDTPVSEVSIDFSPAVVKVMLEYMYTGAATGLDSVDTLIDVLASADQYEIKGLRELCEYNLASTIKEENVLKLAILSSEHKMADLKEKTIKFIAMNLKQIMNSSDWESFFSNHADIVTDLLQHMANVQPSSFSQQSNSASDSFNWSQTVQQIQRNGNKGSSTKGVLFGSGNTPSTSNFLQGIASSGNQGNFGFSTAQSSPASSLFGSTAGFGSGQVPQLGGVTFGGLPPQSLNNSQAQPNLLGASGSTAAFGAAPPVVRNETMKRFHDANQEPSTVMNLSNSSSDN